MGSTRRRDVTAALGTAQSEWRQRLLDELARAVDVWVDDALQLKEEGFTSAELAEGGRVVSRHDFKLMRLSEVGYAQSMSDV